MPRHISIDLSIRSIDEAIRQLRTYQSSLDSKRDRFVRAFADRIAEYANAGFSSAVVNDIVNVGMRPASVSVSVDPVTDGVTAVIATGEDAVWVEFGAGVHHNSSVGSSLHPNGVELGFTIGSYGKGKGKGKTWGYYDNGALVLTHGTPAQMPLYNAVLSASNDIEQIAREVFSHD